MTALKIHRYTTATFCFPGFLFTEKSSVEVTTKDVLEIVKKVPKGAFCFYLQNWIKKTTEVDGEQFEKTELEGKSTGKFFLGGTIYTLKELKQKFGNDADKRTLLSNVEGNRWKRVIQCSTGNWQPFEKGDRLLQVEA